MSFRRLALASVALAGLAATPALAQDWSGPYFGAAVGYAKQTGEDNETIQFDKDLNGTYGDTVLTTGGANAFSPGFCSGGANTSVPAGGCTEKDDGIDFQVRGGYDWQFGAWVVGGVAEFGVADVEDGVTAFSTTPAYYTFERNISNMLAARLRVGYTVGDYLPYVTGGGVTAKVNYNYSTSNLANNFVRSDDSDNVTGYQLGAGVEKVIMPGVRFGVEYMFTRLDDDSYRVRATGPVPATNPFILTNAAGTDFRRSGSEFDVQSVRATIAYAF